MIRIYGIVILFFLYGSFMSKSFAQLENILPCNEVERVDLEHDSVKRQKISLNRYPRIVRRWATISKSF
jgi:hypothetical protein